MNDRDFINWLKGFIEATHDYQPTPKQWDTLKETLASINRESTLTKPTYTTSTTQQVNTTQQLND